MKVAIVGARAHEDPAQIREFVATLPAGTVVVSGGARGVDRWAEEAARSRGLEVISIRPDWSKGKGAGFARNADIVKAADEVHAFIWGESRGTQNTIERARRAGKPVTIHEPR